MKLLSAQNLKKWRGKTCLLRVDLNIEPGASTGSFRVEAIVPTVKLLTKSGITVVMLSHRGRPTQSAAKTTAGRERLSLAEFAPTLTRKTGIKVQFISDFKFSEIAASIRSAKPGSVFLLENLRYLPGEEKNDRALARKLSSLGDFYVNDAFAVCHRSDASVVALAKLRPAFGGLLLEHELEVLGSVRARHAKPFTIIIGGAKVSDKIGVLTTLGKKADHILLAGGPANTYMLAKGLPIGASVADRESVSFISKFISDKRVVAPRDVKIGDKMILDVGQHTIEAFAEIIKRSKQVLWNGPMGLYERKGFESGTRQLWRHLIAASERGTQVIVGGGETTASLSLVGGKVPSGKRFFVSTGGGAMLEYLSGKKLPGIEALR
jgi:phosphoglycerate kinase